MQSSITYRQIPSFYSTVSSSENVMLHYFMAEDEKKKKKKKKGDLVYSTRYLVQNDGKKRNT